MIYPSKSCLSAFCEKKMALKTFANFSKTNLWVKLGKNYPFQTSLLLLNNLFILEKNINHINESFYFVFYLNDGVLFMNLKKHLNNTHGRNSHPFKHYYVSLKYAKTEFKRLF